MKLRNHTEVVARETLDDILKERDDICDCKLCRNDILSITLNNLPPRYYVTQKGEVYQRAEDLDQVNMADIYKELTKAIMKIKKNPRHA